MHIKTLTIKTDKQIIMTTYDKHNKEPRENYASNPY